MAKTATRKKKTVRATRRTTGMAAMPTNKGYEFAKYYVHHQVESREWGASVKGYVKRFMSKEAASAINKLPDWKTSMYSHQATTAWLLANDVDIVPEERRAHLERWLDELVNEGKKIVAAKKAEEKTKKKAHVPSIQERLEEATIDKMEELDQWVDDWMRDPKKNTLKDKMPLNLFRKLEINLGHARFIQKFYEGSYQEVDELVNLPAPKKQDEMQKQLAEGYNHLTKTQQKELHGFMQRIFQALDIIRAEKKQTRAVRKPKQKSAADLVKKLKFKASDPDYGIASINPADIIGATALVVFNCKTRKLGIYYAEDHATLSVKGTTLQFFSENTSRQKTVRKPNEVLPNWKKVTKHKLKTQFGYLKTTDTKMNGRLNEDTIILKAFK